MTQTRYTASGRSPRLFLDQDLSGSKTTALAPEHAHYVRNVLRMKPGDGVLVFNGRDGEWHAEITELTRKGVTLYVSELSRPQTPAGDLHYLFAPLKHARLDYMVQKATEMGASKLQPVLTQHAQVKRINVDRMRANAVEAAEQCGLLTVPEIGDVIGLQALIADWSEERTLVFADEAASVEPAAERLLALRGRPIAVLVGPEGGFSHEERDLLRGLPYVVPVSLGPRVLRADTAAVAALTLVQAVAGDWT